MRGLKPCCILGGLQPGAGVWGSMAAAWPPLWHCSRAALVAHAQGHQQDTPLPSLAPSYAEAGVSRALRCRRALCWVWGAGVTRPVQERCRDTAT